MQGTQGFTLLESLVTVGLAAALAGLGLVRIPELASGLRLAGAARTLATTLRLARGRALAIGAPVEVRFDVAASAIEVVGAEPEPARRPLPGGVAFAAVPVRARIRFGGLGTAENGTVVLAAGGRRRSVVVNQRGRVRVP
ncbi:MAG TPA: GspH/FimT family protein [Candidatus Binatia bacterium]|nr:GspH/FimT family protein [Candidatus Binatia bacterium]